MGCQQLRSVAREEFQWKHFRLNHHTDRDFHCCQWRIPHIVYILLRLLLAGYAVFSMVRILRPLKDAFSILKEYKAFTIWSYTVLTLHLVLSFVLSVVFYRTSKYGTHGKSRTTSTVALATTHQATDPETPDFPPGLSITNPNYDGPENFDLQPSTNNPINQKTRWFFKMSLVLSTIASASAPVVTIVFFTFLYNGPSLVDLNNTNVHALNMAFVMFDHLISARPVRLVHVYLPFVYSAAYLLFTLVYFFTTHKFVYHILNPNHPGEFAIVFTALIFMAFVVHILLFGLYRLKRRICEKLYY